MARGIYKRTNEMKTGRFKRSSEMNKKISSALTGRKLNTEHKKNLSEAKKKMYQTGNYNPRKGKKFPPLSIEHKRKLSQINKIRVLEGKHNFWKGGVTSVNKVIRSSMEYKLWRKAVFERDKYICVWGGKEHGSRLEADLIKPFAFFPELRFAIDNGRTLCISCHRKTDTWGWKSYNKNIKRLKEGRI